MSADSKMKKRALPLVAAVVAIIAVAVVAAPQLTSTSTPTSAPAASSPSASAGGTAGGTATTPSQAAPAQKVENGTDVAIDVAALTTQATYFDYDADGVTVELFAMIASDGSVRTALNTCQVCKGSPKAYFVQEGDDFVCQNCQYRFPSVEVGIRRGSCNPVPITAADYASADDETIVVPATFLDKYRTAFASWKSGL